MGRGHGGYTEYRESYRDSGNHKVTDKGAIFIAERYIVSADLIINIWK